MTKVSTLLCKFLGLRKDTEFLEGFRGDWNRLCNAYVTEVAHQLNPELKRQAHDDLFLPLMIDLGKKYTKLHAIYSKQKVLPEPKFISSVDDSFQATLAKMHAFLGINPHPTSRELDPDQGYDVRWAGIMLLDYLADLSKRPYRYISISVMRICIYLLVPITLMAAIVALVKTF